MGTPLKIKISKIGLGSDSSWPKLGLEPKFHETWTFGGFGKRGQTNKHTIFMFSKYRCIYTEIYSFRFSGRDLRNPEYTIVEPASEYTLHQ